jgi:CRP/FNR family cyclic AMP-dependent transcriptional regulator
MVERDGWTGPDPGEHNFHRADLMAVSRRGFLARLDPDLAKHLVRGSHSARYPAGTILSSPPDGIGPALVLAGRLRFFLLAPEGRQLTVHYALPGDIIGTVLRDESEVAGRLEVLQPATLLHLDEARVRCLAQQDAALGWALMGEAMDRLRAAYRMLAMRAFSTVRVRVARDLVELGEMSGGLERGMNLAVTHQSLADAAGSVREVVARTVRDLRHERVIATNAEGITVIDPAALKRAAGL